MRSGSARQDRSFALRQASAPNGFSLIELLVVMAIVLIVTAISIPVIQNAMSGYKLKSTVLAVTGAIQGTRYRAIASGYKYTVVFDSTNLTYQVQSDPAGGTTFGNVGGTVPLSSSSAKPALNQNTTFQFKPNGSVSATTGAMTLIVTLAGKAETITVSNYGSISVAP
jgi:prepilin-type N-terminal cleavage/methylation domain-containing protein